MAVVLVVVIPVVRVILQSRTARRVAVVSMKESARELCAKAANAKITKAAGELCVARPKRSASHRGEARCGACGHSDGL